MDGCVRDFGEKAIEYLLGARATLKAVWAFADIANGLMTPPNPIPLIVLSGVIVAETRKHLLENSELDKNV